MWVVRQADDPFVCFGAKPNKGLSSTSLTRLEVGKGTPEKKLEKGTDVTIPLAAPCTYKLL